MLQLDSTCSQVLHFSGAGAEEGNCCSEDKPSGWSKGNAGLGGMRCTLQGVVESHKRGWNWLPMFLKILSWGWLRPPRQACFKVHQNSLIWLEADVSQTSPRSHRGMYWGMSRRHLVVRPTLLDFCTTSVLAGWMSLLAAMANVLMQSSMTMRLLAIAGTVDDGTWWDGWGGSHEWMLVDSICCG